MRWIFLWCSAERARACVPVCLCGMSWALRAPGAPPACSACLKAGSCCSCLPWPRPSVQPPLTTPFSHSPQNPSHPPQALPVRARVPAARDAPGAGLDDAAPPRHTPRAGGGAARGARRAFFLRPGGAPSCCLIAVGLGVQMPAGKQVEGLSRPLRTPFGRPSTAPVRPARCGAAAARRCGAWRPTRRARWWRCPCRSRRRPSRPTCDAAPAAAMTVVGPEMTPLHAALSI